MLQFFLHFTTVFVFQPCLLPYEKHNSCVFSNYQYFPMFLELTSCLEIEAKVGPASILVTSTDAMWCGGKNVD